MKVSEVKEAIAHTRSLINSYRHWQDDAFVQQLIDKEQRVIDKAQAQIAIYEKRHAGASEQLATLEAQLVFQEKLLVKVQSGSRVAKLLKLMAEVQKLQAEMDAE